MDIYDEYPLSETELIFYIMSHYKFCILDPSIMDTHDPKEVIKCDLNIPVTTNPLLKELNVDLWQAMIKDTLSVSSILRTLLDIELDKNTGNLLSYTFIFRDKLLKVVQVSSKNPESYEVYNLIKNEKVATMIMGLLNTLAHYIEEDLVENFYLQTLLTKMVNVFRLYEKLKPEYSKKLKALANN